MKEKAKKAGGEINAVDYLNAAQDHSATLSSLYIGGHYAMTIYASGLAAECLFRAFRAKRGMPFRRDHPLESLAREAGFPDLVPSGEQARFGAALADLIVRWRNNHRFRSNAAIKRFLKDLKLDRGIKGDFLKENARLISSQAIELVNVGVMRWR